MGYQFIHEECYSRESAKSKAGGHSIRSIIAEVDREEKNCPHVQNPKPPQIIYGVIPKEVEAIATEFGEKSTDKLGRKLRKDALCLLAGVVSVPDDFPPKDWEKYKIATVDWLAEKYGDRLKSVVEHTDESHRHMHYYVVPNVGEDFDSIHSGKKLAKAAKLENKPKGEQNSAYIAGMRAFQDDFYLNVACIFGLVRFGPKRTRMTRQEWQTTQHESKLNSLVADTRNRVYKNAFNEGNKKGLDVGYSEGLKTSKKLGSVFGAFVANATKNITKIWHQPTKEAKKEVQDIIDKAKKYARKIIEQTDRKIDEKNNLLRIAKQDLDKQKRIIESLQAENKRYEADRADILTQKINKKKGLTI
jgi:flagellar biosynthesis/type III secretory pathway protein FliH